MNNNVIDTIISRRSIKKYLDRPVEKELIETIVKAGTFAPSGMNRQSAIILAVTDKETRDQLSKINAKLLNIESDPFYGAPVVLVVLAKKDVRTNINDGSLVLGNMMIAAHSLGLGSCWIHRAKETFETEEGRRILEKTGVSPDEYVGVGNCIVGYTDESGIKPQPPRKTDYIYWI
ncbi:MAG: nitroreductase [Candidatus Limimorpha sp.]